MVTATAGILIAFTSCVTSVASFSAGGGPVLLPFVRRTSLSISRLEPRTQGGERMSLPQAFQRSLSDTATQYSTTAISLARTRGMEIQAEGATPTEGGMSLYVKAGPDGTSAGDCPFAHSVRMVLNEKNLSYDLRPSTQDTKPQWLIDHYDGSLPALRHRKECYTESEVIVQYLDFFFKEPQLAGKKKPMAQAREAIDGLFPTIATYLKHTPDCDEEDEALKADVKVALQKIEDQLTAGDDDEGNTKRTGSFLVGDGEMFTMLDCSLAPKLFHLKVASGEFKNNSEDLFADFPALKKYMDDVFARPSFVDTVCPEETIVWGWSNARK
mmetsp:Transcript_20911/g.37771  ORF Transcript_20911/g.37771 Transcript_20911/m.37771 type:complete len:327 (-) Transcript_20911:48-1028(-)